MRLLAAALLIVECHPALALRAGGRNTGLKIGLDLGLLDLLRAQVERRPKRQLAIEQHRLRRVQRVGDGCDIVRAAALKALDQRREIAGRLQAVGHRAHQPNPGHIQIGIAEDLAVEAIFDRAPLGKVRLYLCLCHRSGRRRPARQDVPWRG